MIVNRKICVLGLGSMGMGVALSLLERQFEVVGFDVNKNAMKGLEEAGGTVKNSVKSAVENCTAVIVLVVNDKQVEEDKNKNNNQILTNMFKKLNSEKE
mgnify:CR=1 FL=1